MIPTLDTPETAVTTVAQVIQLAVAPVFLLAGIGALQVPSAYSIFQNTLSQLVWAVLLGWAIWQTHMLPTSWAGAAVIVASGLYTIYREHKLGRDKPRPQPLQP